jgi:L-alanine-DL-glutamate epimerase-like enolase superfamily enzyme
VVSIAPIADVEVIPFQSAESPDDCDGAADTVVVQLTDEEGRSGIGEADAPAEVVRAFIEMPDLHVWSRGLRGLLIGRNPFPIPALWDSLYEGSIYPGRRGAGIHALSAVDIALYDLAGKQLGRPAYELLGGARRDELVPYATLFPGMPQGRGIGALKREIHALIDRALELGFRAVKVEALFDELVSDNELAELLIAARGRLGDESALLVDFGYRWRDWRSALRTLERAGEADLYLAEATLGHDDLEGHARLAVRVSTRIGGAEFAATRFECREWLERGRVDVLQPDPNRAGGLTELQRVAELAARHAASVIPHGWKTGITVAANMHLHAATANVPLFELVSPELWSSPLRRELTTPEPALRDGVLALPTLPGLGIELDPDTVARYRTDVTA